MLFEERLFENPCNDKFAWVGSYHTTKILLQDFRYSRDVIPWKDIQLLLEGETVKLPAPKSQYSTDVVIDTDIPIFATSKSPIMFKGQMAISKLLCCCRRKAHWHCSASG